MNISLSRLDFLLDAFLQEKCSDEEVQELMAVIREGRHDEYIKSFVEDWVEKNDLGAEVMESGKSEEIFNRVLEAGTNTPVRRLFDWRKLAAALLILTGLSIAIHYLADKNAQVVSPTVANTEIQVDYDIMPGRSGAVLILADGRQVLLDSSRDGTISFQGNAAVDIKNGEVRYEAKGSDTAVVYNTMATPRGRKYRLVLSDGSIIWLNSESSITFPTSFPGNERMVTIKGEAYFDIARNINKPFIVKIDDRQKIVVLGTQFNINAYENEGVIKTTLIKGSIQVEGNRGESVVLKPGQQTTLTANGHIKARGNIDIDAVMAWKNGLFHFKNADIKTVMRQLSRWYDVEVEYPDQLPDWSFTGEIGDKLTLKEVMNGLAFTNIKFKIDGKKITLFPD